MDDNETLRVEIDPLTLQVLLVETYFDDKLLGNASAFIVSSNQKTFLITNWHVVSGKNSETGENLHKHAGIPNKIRIWHHQKGKLGEWIPIDQKLRLPNDDNLWLEHPRGSEVDVVALSLIADLGQVDIYPLDLALTNTNMSDVPATPVSIVGFPFGHAVLGKFPIWKTGHIASDINLDYQGTPSFLIDATTRGGMSGSPVYCRAIGPYILKNGGVVLSSSITTRFMGVYSGRIKFREKNNETGEYIEIGRVWKPIVIKQIIGER